MTGILALLAGAGTSSDLAIAANDVTRVEGDFAASGLVTTTQLPNTFISGGVPPYSVAWTYQSGSTVPTISDPALLNPQWSGVVSDNETAVWRATVTDAATATTFVDINVSLSWLDFN